MESNQVPVAPKVSRAQSLLNRVQGITPPAEAPVAPTIPPVIESKKQEAVAVPTDVPNEYEINPQPKAVAPAPVKEEGYQTEEVDQFISANEKGISEQTGFKNLRTRLKTVTHQSKAQAAELETLRKKVTDYESGLAVPEITAEQTARIAELEKYEKLYNLKATPAYREKIIAPIQAETAKLQSLAKDYGVSDEVLQAAFAAPTAAETNRILSQHFQDDVGALEAKSLIKNIRGIRAEAAELEKEPAQAFTRMQEESDRIVAEKRARANESIVHTSKDSWVESLTELRADPRFPELSYREGDTEHNEKFVRPILTKAGQEYGKMVKALAEHGLTEMPKDLGVAMSKMVQLAHQSGILAHQREVLSARVAELESLLKINNGLNRPGVTSNSSAPAPARMNGRPGVGAENAARNVLSRVLK